MKKLNASQYVLIAIMVVMLAAVAELMRYQSLPTKAMPVVVSGSIFVLCTIQLWREVRAKSAAEPDIGDSESVVDERDPPESHGYFSIVVWLVGFALAIYMVGFYIASFVLILSYMKQHRSKWLSAVIVSSLSTAILYLVFQVALRVDLYPGLLPLLFPK